MEQMELDRKKTDNRDGVEAVEGNEPVAAEQAAKPLTVAQKILAVRERCDGISKESAGVGTGHSIEGVLSSVRPLLNRHRLLVTPNLTSVTYDGNRCNVLVSFTWECVDTGESRVITWGGSDTDKAGKGLAKALTNAAKEHLKKLLLITDRTDVVEAEESVEHETTETVSRKAAEKAKDDVRAMFHAWATNLTRAVKTSPDTKALAQLKRENAEQLANPELPDVTRGHLNELFADRKKALEEFEAEQSAENEETLG